jgi:hypothetical protein
MNTFLALALGYVIGAKTKGQDLDRLGRSLKALYGTDEFAEVVTAARLQAGHTLHDLAEIVAGEHGGTDAGGGDLVARVRSLVGRD